ALDAFTDGKVHALIATDVAARGIHVDGVASVVHYDPPEDHKTYIHRSGRTARAGAGGLVVSLVQPDQRSDYRKIQRKVGLDEALDDRRSADEPEVVQASVPTLAGVDKPKPQPRSKNGKGGKNGNRNRNRKNQNGQNRNGESRNDRNRNGESRQRRDDRQGESSERSGDRRPSNQGGRNERPHGGKGGGQNRNRNRNRNRNANSSRSR
ncbi:MAG: C-terminal helicase domain-containing protein, partial [Ilumatobacter fluminis]